MRNYFLRRVLLIPPTLFGITLIVFVITRFVPGGPLERAIMEAQQMNTSGRGGSVSGQGQALSESQIQQLKEYYGFDKPWYQSYVQWVGKLLRGDLGSSYRYNEPVWSIMKDHFPVSLFFGIATIVATYVVCIPLGVVKAIRHRTVIDNLTSVVIFMGYAVPGYVLGTLLLLFFAARLEWFPMSGFTSMDYTFMSASEKVADLAKHAVLPLICYLVGSFAVTTLLMKNHLMDNLAADYIRTAVAKGVSFRRAVIGPRAAQLADPDRHHLRPEHRAHRHRLVPDRDHLRHQRLRAARRQRHLRPRLPGGDGRRLGRQRRAPDRQHRLRRAGGGGRSAHPLRLRSAMGLRLNPLTQRKLRRFREIRRGYWSFLVLVALVVLSLGAELLINSRALAVRYQGRLVLPDLLGGEAGRGLRARRSRRAHSGQLPRAEGALRGRRAAATA